MPRLSIVIFLLAVLALNACSEKTVDPGPSGPATLDISPLLQFDSSRNYMLISPGTWSIGEEYVDGERVIGEPFIDMNGNGVYDRGIDIFIKSADPDLNMDLNYNGEHDGPYDPWEIGVPFDDYNGNGTYDRGNSVYDSSEAFCDLNGNGIRNETIRDTLIRIVRPRTDTYSAGGFVQEFGILDSSWQFVSDSGYSTRLPRRSTHTWDNSRSLPKAFDYATFCYDSALTYLARSYQNDTLVVPIFDSLLAPLANKRITAEWLHDEHAAFEFDRRIRLHDTLTVQGVLHTGLVRVTFDNLGCSDSVLAASYGDVELSIWFDLDCGPLAIRSGTLLIHPTEIYLVPLADTLPLGMTR